jgi:hypothetical protein
VGSTRADIEQVAVVWLILAVDRSDVTRFDFLSFAVPTINGRSSERGRRILLLRFCSER